MNKRLDLKAMIEHQNLNVIAVTKSFLSKDISDSELISEIGGAVPLNQIFRKDRNEHGGGVMLMVRNNVPTTRRSDLESLCELMWVELSLNALKILVGVFYNPPSSNTDALLQLHGTLAAIPDSSNILLCGDFNLPTINWRLDPPSAPTSNSAMLCNIIDDFNLSQLVLEPTRLDNILDLLLTNRADIVSDLIVADGLPGSDHDGIFYTLNVIKKRITTHHRRMYNFKKADFDKFRDMLCSTPWDCCFLTDSLDECWENFKDIFLSVADMCIPSTVIRHAKRMSWLSDDTLRLIHKKR